MGCCGFGFGDSSTSKLSVLPEATLNSGTVSSDSPANTTHRTHVGTSDDVSHVPTTRYVFAHLSNPSRIKATFLLSPESDSSAFAFVIT